MFLLYHWQVFFWNGNFFGKAAGGGVDGEVEFAHVAAAAIVADEAALAHEGVAVAHVLVFEAGGQVQGADACFCQGDEFSGFGLAVESVVFPEFQLSKGGVRGVQYAVAIAVERG